MHHGDFHLIDFRKRRYYTTLKGSHSSKASLEHQWFRHCDFTQTTSIDSGATGYLNSIKTNKTP